MFIITSFTTLSQTTAELEALALQTMQREKDPQLRNPNIEITPLAHNANTPPCQQPVTARWNSQKRYGVVHLALSCTQPRWQRYVSGRIHGELPVIFATQDLTSGQALNDQNTYLAWQDANLRLPNTLTDPQKVNDYSVRHFIARDTPIQLQQLQPRVLIKKGTQITITTSNAQIRIEMPGTALEDGIKNKQIRVQNNTSGKVIKAWVVSADRVVVD
jgi:flagella basal body P-ring formation protein FlgA